MSARGIISDLFAEEDNLSDSAEEAADQMLAALERRGYRIVPFEPTEAIKKAWRQCQRDHPGPVAQWKAMLDALGNET